MRRKDRKVENINDILKIISKAEVLRLILKDNGTPYIVPLNFAHSYENGEINFYFHSAVAGKKIDLIKKNKKAYFELDNFFKLIKGEKACQWSLNFESVLGEGEIFILNEDKQVQKIKALDLIMEKFGFLGKPIYDENIFKKTAILQLKVNSFSGKSNCLNENNC